MFALEVIPIPVSDVDHALKFYTEQVGFALDIDYRPTPGFRVVQLTPSGSACSIHLTNSASAARLQGLVLVTSDIAAAREVLIGRGVKVSYIRHKTPLETWSGEFEAGLDTGRRDYASFADFADPDGNGWTLQERGYSGIDRNNA
jgi:catechol 2,3-dioxygenase-like lactoylglutathione lyase family enzyme